MFIHFKRLAGFSLADYFIYFLLKIFNFLTLYFFPSIAFSLSLSCTLPKVWFSNRRARWRKQMGSQQLNGFSAALASLPAMHAAYSTSAATNPYLLAAAQAETNNPYNTNQGKFSDCFSFLSILIFIYFLNLFQ